MKEGSRGLGISARQKQNVGALRCGLAEAFRELLRGDHARQILIVREVGIIANRNETKKVPQVKLILKC